eukprot:scaffold2281_cov215-Alexandrium_tamarense.AAC.1
MQIVEELKDSDDGYHDEMKKREEGLLYECVECYVDLHTLECKTFRSANEMIAGEILDCSFALILGRREQLTLPVDS